MYLVRKDEVDIYDIPIARITEQYIHYIEILKNLDIDLAGDFLVMAATLMQIKSAMLLPRAEPEQMEGEDLSDPRTELIRQLLEYKKFKDAANLLNSVADAAKERFARPSVAIDQAKEADNEPAVDIEQVSVWDLLEAFDSIMQATGSNLVIDHIDDETPIDLYQIEILHRLQSEGPMSFERIFECKGGRLAMVGLFLALLELVREGLIGAEQPEFLASIFLRALTDEPAEIAVQRMVEAGEVEAEAETEEQPEQAAQDQPRPQPPIPIAELPAKTQPTTPLKSEELTTEELTAD